jgi:hypothetical protein
VTPYRRGLIGLPLQQSLFAAIDRAPRAIGLGQVLPGGRLNARLDEAGDLYLDRSHVDALVTALTTRPDRTRLRVMDRALRAAYDGTRGATERAARDAPNPARARAALRVLGERLTHLVSFGILSKFVPDALYRALGAVAGPVAPPRETETPGAAVARDAAALARDCAALGVPPDRLARDWPDVDPRAATRVHVFCRDHAGFGPLAWDALGYEDPPYVVALLRATFDGGDAAGVPGRLAAPAPATGNGTRADPTAAALWRSLANWLAFLERETWCVRRAFYVGLIPLLRRLAPAARDADARLTPDHLLFFRLDELVAGDLDATRAAARRARYLADGAYLSRHGVSAGRLGALLGGAE